MIQLRRTLSLSHINQQNHNFMVMEHKFKMTVAVKSSTCNIMTLNVLVFCVCSIVCRENTALLSFVQRNSFQFGNTANSIIIFQNHAKLWVTYNHDLPQLF